MLSIHTVGSVSPKRVIYREGQSERSRVIYRGQSEAALSTGGSPKPRYLPGGQSEAALSTVPVCDLGLIWGNQHR